MSNRELARFVVDARCDGELEDQARREGATGEPLVAFARSRGCDVALSDLPAETRQVRGNTIGGVGAADRFGFWGRRSAPRRHKKDRL